MNKQQIIDLVKGLLTAGGPVVIILTTVFHLENKVAIDIVNAVAAIATVGGLVWLALGRSDSNMVLDAKEVKGVQVHVNTDTAPKAVVKLAEDNKVTDVFPMEGGPRVPPKDEDAHEGPAPSEAPTYRKP